MSAEAVGEASVARQVSNAVRVLMALARESQSDVAKVLGVPQSAVSARLRGQTKWTVDDLETLAKHYQKPITVFFVNVDAMLSPPRRGHNGHSLSRSDSSSCSSGRLRTRLHRPDRVSVA
jgi:predicted XRE-type DNA-binding protein